LWANANSTVSYLKQWNKAAFNEAILSSDMTQNSYGHFDAQFRAVCLTHVRRYPDISCFIRHAACFDTAVCCRRSMHSQLPLARSHNCAQALCTCTFISHLSLLCTRPFAVQGLGVTEAGSACQGRQMYALIMLRCTGQEKYQGMMLVLVLDIPWSIASLTATRTKPNARSSSNSRSTRHACFVCVLIKYCMRGLCSKCRHFSLFF
jgi:hypothetical protein